MNILETERLLLREMTPNDLESLCRTLKDDKVMAAYEGAFDDAMVGEWLENQFRRYREDGFGLWAVILKETGQWVGRCGLTWQEFDGRQVLEVGYLLERAYWHNGYATEAAVACKEYAFQNLHAREVYSIIRDSNTASQRVAMRNGMMPVGSLVKHYRGVKMPHLVFCVKREP